MYGWWGRGGHRETAFSPSERQWEEERGSRQASIQSPEGVQCLRAGMTPPTEPPPFCHPRPSGTETTALPQTSRAFDAEQWGRDGRDIGVLQSSSSSLVNVGKTGKPRAGWAGARSRGKASPHLCRRETKTGLSNLKRSCGTEWGEPLNQNVVGKGKRKKNTKSNLKKKRRGICIRKKRTFMVCNVALLWQHRYKHASHRLKVRFFFSFF